MYAIVDIDTTGEHDSANGISEITICLHNVKKVNPHKSVLVNPRIPMPVSIIKLIAITGEQVLIAPAVITNRKIQTYTAGIKGTFKRANAYCQSTETGCRCPASVNGSILFS